METDLSFGGWLKRRRRSLDLTQAELARRVGYAQVTIHKIEAGELRPSRQIAETLAEQLGIAPAEREAFLRFARDVRGDPAPALGDIVDPVSLPAARRRSPNLPTPPTRLIGREKEVTAAQTLLRGDTRLLTLTGPPGIGKTRLALEVVARLVDDYAKNVWFIPLAAIRDPTLVASVLANALDIREAGSRSLVESLRDRLRDEPMLLVLDNFEQVVEAAPLVADLLEIAPRLRVVVTSRETLRVRGEQLFVVPPLSLPDLETPLRPGEDLVAATTRSEAVRLFVARAQDVKPSFTVTPGNAAVVAEICRCLDGLPLAIELAAARVRLLPPHLILPRLTNRLKLLVGGPRDLPARQQTLRGAIAWSHALLDEDEKVLFRRLSVFVGGCTLEAVEAVCLTGDAVDLLESLVRKSLLDQEEREGSEPRFAMREMIREYAWERLVEAGEEAATRERHRDWFVALAERAAPEFVRRDQVSWLDRIEHDHANLRAVLRAAIDSRDVERGFWVANALYLFWLQRHLSEGRVWLARLLEASSSSAPSAQRSRALATAGAHAGVQGDLRMARLLLTEGLDTAQQVEDRAALAFSLLALAAIDRAEGDWATARVRLEASLALWRTVEEPWNLGRCLFLLGELAAGQDRQQDARGRFEESLVLFRELGDRWGIAYTVRALGFAAFRRGEYGAAQAHYNESLALGQEVGDQALVAWTRWGLGLLAFAQADFAVARQRFAVSMTIFRDRSERGAVAHVLGGFAALAAAQGSPERALKLAGAATALRATIGARLLPIDQADFEHWVEPARRVLSDASQAEAREQGQVMTLEQAVGYALRGDNG